MTETAEPVGELPTEVLRALMVAMIAYPFDKETDDRGKRLAVVVATSLVWAAGLAEEVPKDAPPVITFFQSAIGHREPIRVTALAAVFVCYFLLLWGLSVWRSWMAQRSRISDQLDKVVTDAVKRPQGLAEAFDEYTRLVEERLAASKRIAEVEAGYDHERQALLQRGNAAAAELDQQTTRHREQRRAMAISDSAFRDGQVQMAELESIWAREDSIGQAIALETRQLSEQLQQLEPRVQASGERVQKLAVAEIRRASSRGLDRVTTSGRWSRRLHWTLEFAPLALLSGAALVILLVRLAHLSSFL